ncbi:hypothetical protein MBLNU13_g01112t1 [Cladosporium sp. NU13]
MSDDPFLQVQADVLSLLDTTRPLFTSYIRIRSSAASPSNPQLVEAREELESNLTDLSTDLQDLIDSVKAVEGDPYKYGIDIDEVSRRRRLVQDIGAEIEDMHQQLSQTVSKGSLAHPDSFGAAEGDEDDDEYGQFQEQRQMEMMRDQDEALDGVFQTVGNLRMQADTMGRELEEQADMLDDVDNITERVGGKLQTGMKKINFVIRQNEGPHPLLQQTPLSVNPFIDLPKPPTLPHNYASIPSTLPPSSTNAAPAPSNPELPAYVTSSTGFAAHPTSIINQNRALLEQVSSQQRDGHDKVKKWEQGIKDRELQEKRRRAPGWLDSESKLLQPAKKTEDRQEGGKIDLMDQPPAAVDIQTSREQDKTANELGDAMDRAFGRSEMG